MRTKANVSNGFLNATGDVGNSDSINVVAVNSAGTAVAGQNEVNAAVNSQSKCNKLKNLLHIGNCPETITQGSADATVFDPTNSAAYTDYQDTTPSDPGSSVFGGILKALGTYTSPNIGVDVATNPANQGITDTGWVASKPNYTWWIVGGSAVVVIIVVAVIWIRIKRKK